MSHETIATDGGNVKCRRCGKWATKESKLENTKCNPDFDREADVE